MRPPPAVERFLERAHGAALLYWAGAGTDMLVLEEASPTQTRPLRTGMLRDPNSMR